MLLCITTVEKNRNMGRNVLEQFTERTKRAVMRGGKKSRRAVPQKVISCGVTLPLQAQLHQAEFVCYGILRSSGNALEQAAKGGGGITIPGGIKKRRCGTEGDG